MPRFVIAGCTSIDHIITSNGEKIPPKWGGSGIYACVGAWIWSDSVGLVAAVNRTFPQEWLDVLSRWGIDITGVVRLNQSLGLEGTIRYLPDGTRELGAAAGMMGVIQKTLPGLITIMGKKVWPKVCPSPDLVPAAY